MSGRGAGDAPVTYHGEWDAALQYDPRAIVQHGGSAYMSVARSTGVEPDPGSETPWLPLGGGGTATFFAYDYVVL